MAWQKHLEQGRAATLTVSHPIARPLLLVRWIFRAAVQAGFDAGRAWAVVPHVSRKSVYDRNEAGGWRVRQRRRFRRKEVLRLKVAAFRRVLVSSFKLGIARSVRIPRFPEEGLLANVLHVLEAVHRVRPDARVHVDWALTGAEIAFRYGHPGENIWNRLFQTLVPPPAGTAHQAISRLDFGFWGTGKDHLSGNSLAKHRHAYHSTVLKRVEIINERVLEEVRRTSEQFFDGRFCIGIHRRVGNALVADLQSNGNAPSLDSYINIVESAVSTMASEGIQDFAIFLATDDADAVNVFKNAFGSRLIVRDNVQRTTADAPEVHFGAWEQLSITDAEDVLIDTVLLSQCNLLVHASSSVSTVASIINPDLILVRA